ncbi:malolactic enzyme [Vagococcus vulneris]|uniref:Malolactic enzyme n=1 Tax=Vagococcus vulneris TaxID=1977869 RepID=A0A429ZWL3_9ENTE|nr:malolactic enzyme [Vagococcus vulneris]RST98141.1 NAD-dependent malic enzyme [Vagococcus vulneris]
MKSAYQVLNNPFLNKGTAFTKEERKRFGLTGLIPPKVQTIEEQANQVYDQYSSKSSDLEKRLFLMEIFNTNRTLFYYLFSQHMVEFMPIVYDPTIADTIENYSELFIQPQNAIYLSIDEPELMEETLKNGADGRDIQLIVVTDAEGILGIGDWGVNGVDISVGKLMVYTAAAGIDPSTVMPVVLDVGTNREELLKDPLYLGNRHERIRGDKYYEFVDQFVKTTEKLFPKLYLHWEDFGRLNAANILNKYKENITTFNDDIQGTGIVTLAGILGALNISGEKITDQVYLSFGAGTAGAGIISRIYEEMLQQGLSEDEARKHFYLVDKQGLLFDDMDDLTPEQKPFTRKRSEFKNANQLTTLKAVVQEIHPTILVGTSTMAGAFTEDIVKEMAAHTERPIIFPLSNPTKLAEATAQDLITWTDGKALVATGIPAAPVEYKGVTYEIGQANNALVYPGLGLGTIASTAKVLNDTMISEAAHSLGGIVDTSKDGAAVLPPVSKLTEFSETVAVAVGESAVNQGITKESISDIKAAIEKIKWQPKYQSLNN